MPTGEEPIKDKDPEIIEASRKPLSGDYKPVDPSVSASLLAITSTEETVAVPPSMEGALDHVKNAMGHFVNMETTNVETIAAVESLVAAINLLARMVVQMGTESNARIVELTERLTNELLSKAALKVAAYRDRLTGIGNQASLIEFGPKLFEKAKESRRPLSCLMLDIDFFKSVNDGYGHPVGDQVLTQLALRLREALRTSDFLMRIGEDEDLGNRNEKQGELFDMMTRAGGEEFCILLAGTPLDGACIAAERVREAVESKPFVVTNKYGEQIKLNISVSIGVAEADFQRIESVDQLKMQSDSALYLAKRGGRNAVAKIQVTPDGTQTFKVITPDDRYKPQGQRHD